MLMRNFKKLEKLKFQIVNSYIDIERHKIKIDRSIIRFA